MIRSLPRSTAGLVAWIGVIMATATVLLGLAVYSVAHEALELQLDHRIEAETRALIVLRDHNGAASLADSVRRRAEAGASSRMGYLLTDASGRRVAGNLAAPAGPAGWNEFLPTLRPDGRRGQSQALTTVLSDGGRLVVAADRAAIAEIDGTILRVFAGAFGAMLVVGMAGAWAIGAVTRRRLERINATAQAIIAGDLARRIPRDQAPNEFDELAATLNRMLDRNADLLENLQQVSSDIAHDLRTPLTRLQQTLDGALDAELDGEQMRAVLKRASGHAQDLLGLFAALLRISEVESLQVRSSFKPVCLSEVVERCADAFRPDLEAGGRHLVVEVDAEAWVDGDRHLLSQLVVNLIENAARHTPCGARVTLSVRREAGRVALRVADDGPGIAPEDRERVLRRFARLERSRATPGHGLGLSLVAAIARAHFGELTLGGNRPGLAVLVALPARSTP